MRKHLLAPLLLFTISAPAQVFRQPLSAPCIGIGAYSTEHTDVFSSAGNVAALAQLQTVTAGVYSERRFMLSALSSYTVAAGMTTSSGNFALNANLSGDSDYNETETGIAYARKLGRKLNIGARFNYYGIRTAGYGRASAVGFDVGVIMHLSEKLHSGCQVSNPAGGAFGKGKHEKIPSVYSFGLGYDASEKLLVSVVIQKEEDQPVNVNAGILYKFLPQLSVKTGVSTSTSSVWCGIGLGIRKLRVELISSFHPQLGITPGLLLIFNFHNASK